jgi:hypothetical protein
VEWSVGSVVLLRKSEGDEEGRMEMVHEIFLGGDDRDESGSERRKMSAWSGPPVPCRTWKYDGREGGWTPLAFPLEVSSQPIPSPTASLKLATYNILHDPSFPISSRIYTLLRTILSKEAEADVLCLQEVSDEALEVLFPHQHAVSIREVRSLRASHMIQVYLSLSFTTVTGQC